jgi:hypothetical protein
MSNPISKQTIYHFYACYVRTQGEWRLRNGRVEYRNGSFCSAWRISVFDYIVPLRYFIRTSNE